MSDLVWGTVTALSPLRVRLDGDTSAIPATPDSLIDSAALAVSDRVRCEVTANRVIVLGRFGGEPWVAQVANAVSSLRARNLIVNGNFRTNQRSYTSGGALAERAYGHDMWQCAGIVNLVTNPNGETNTTGWTAVACTLTRSTVWSSSGSASLALSSPSSNSAHMETAPITTVPGRRYTVSATARLSAALTGAEIDSARARGIQVVASGTTTIAISPQAPNVAGSSRVSVSFVATTTDTRLWLWHGQTGGTIWWDDVMLTEGDTLWPYFDGSFSDCAWTGTANASTSRRGPASGSYTFTALPQGQTITLASDAGLMQIIAREDVDAGTHVLSWSGTATGRVYNVGTAPGSLPAFAASGATFTLDGLDDVVVEFRAAGGTKTLGQVQLERGSTVTPYEQVPLAIELLRCMREYHRLSIGPSEIGQTFAVGGAGGTGTGTSYFGYRFPVTMRRNPDRYLSGSIGAIRTHSPGVASAAWTAASIDAATSRDGAMISGSHSATGFVTSAGVLLQGAGTAGATAVFEFECRR